MRKHLWGIIAGVCVLALVVAAAIFIPRLFGDSHSEAEPVKLIPAHWWKADLTQQQLGTLAGLWGSDITAAQLLQQLWPEVLQEMPEEAASTLERHVVRWPTEKYEDWKTGFICGGAGVTHEDGPVMYDYYIGDPSWESDTLMQSAETVAERGFAEDRTYRASLYTKPQQEGQT